jgi:hypothetical protein
MVMELKLQNAAQHQIADMLWAAQTEKEVKAILFMFGKDAHVVYNMMVAASFDEVTDTELAKSVLDQFRV